jgi:hypothetical protein
MSTPVANSRVTKLTRWYVLGRVPISSLLVNRVMPFAAYWGRICATTTARYGPGLKIPCKNSSHIVIILSHAKETLLLSIPDGQYRHTLRVSWKTQFLGFGSPDRGQPAQTHERARTHTQIRINNTCTRTPIFEYQPHYSRCCQPWIYSIFHVSTLVTSQYSVFMFL